MKKSGLNYTMDQMEIMGIHRILHPTNTEYTFLSVATRTVSKIDHIVSLNQMQKNQNNLLYLIT